MVYDRKILVPYLENLYSLEMAWVILDTRKDQLQDQVQSAKRNIKNYNQNLIIEKKRINESLLPRIIKIFFQRLADFWDASSALGGLFYALLGCPALFAFIGVLSFNYCNNGLFGIFKNFSSLFKNAYFIFLSIILVFELLLAISHSIGELKEEKSDAEQAYQEALQTQATQKKWHDASKNILPQAEAKLKKVEKEINKIEDMLSDSYDANIIPWDYRERAAITYLYQYFSTSNANDLDQVIQTFMLEQIHEQLERIENQVNQILSNQDYMIEKLQDIHTEAQNQTKMTSQIKKSVLQLKDSDDRKEKYLDMIECNTKASAYFQAATYLEAARN